MISERDKTTEDVREHLERLIESYVDEGIASVSLARLFDNPQCKNEYNFLHIRIASAYSFDLSLSKDCLIANLSSNWW